MDRVDRRDLGGGGREQALRARDLIRERSSRRPLPCSPSRRAPRRGPRRPRSARRAADARARRCRRANIAFAVSVATTSDLDRADRHAGLRLERVEIMAEARRCPPRRSPSGTSDAVEPRLHDGGEIVERQAGVERVDADEERPVARRRVVEKARDMRRAPPPSARARRNPRDRGSARPRRTPAPWRTCARESPGTNSSERSFMTAFSSSARRAGRTQTTSSRWLKPLCSKVTIPCVGRDLLSRSCDHRRLRADRVAGEDRLRKGDFLPAEIADRRAERGVLHRKADDEPEREDAS